MVKTMTGDTGATGVGATVSQGVVATKDVKSMIRDLMLKKAPSMFEREVNHGMHMPSLDALIDEILALVQ